jgi:hypothetical protein
MISFRINIISKNSNDQIQTIDDVSLELLILKKWWKLDDNVDLAAHRYQVSEAQADMVKSLVDPDMKKFINPNIYDIFLEVIICPQCVKLA